LIWTARKIAWIAEAKLLITDALIEEGQKAKAALEKNESDNNPIQDKDA